MSLQMLETEISYTSTPLPDAFQNVSVKSRSPAKELFMEAGCNLKSRTYSTVGEAFEKALDTIKDRMSIAKEDIEVLKSFGYSMGTSDTEGQVKSFRLVLKQLEGQEVKAEELRNKNERLYKSLGLLGGIAVTILLI
jgi:stage III sporulation protein AB